ncbi:glycosyltransferase [Desulforhabdus amnigena]|jgi:glycosyltransferase involved in cell wall biosynthesis|uniref:Glycosyl transferase n=1 Tax=Desulforhabdus amnigena TaxID=40218 RepID=A0A9W6CZ88_9BACT|nr:glycosyltransferase [Desulforhabdus amnigena]NLJ26928.1 glycosyltransferase [Deltaproteobacteria bacterium]GLI34516.1 glycosyl transferase [Desulforhabdus amnigena]
MAFYEENPHQITKADMVVAIPSFNEAETIGRTAELAAKGLTDFFGNLKCVLINCDNHSADGTKEAFLSAPGEIPKIYLSTPPGVHGKGNNLRNLFEKVRELEARAIVVVESDIKNFAPFWIKNLGEPILKGAGYVCPLYVRHKYEITLTSSIVYPLIRCLYGRRVRQPNAGDFGFSGKLVDAFLDSPVWTESVQHFGIDIWMTTIALNARLPICQAFIGAPKVHRLKDPYAHLSVLFHQIVGTIFDMMEVYPDFWKQVKWSKPTALYGTDIHEVETPLPVEINATRLHERFLQGFDKYTNMWQLIYDQTVCPKLQEIRSMGLQHFSFPTQTWARILYDAALAYHRAEASEKDRILDSLLPLYLGKVLSFVKKTERMSVQQAEEYIENECMIFEENKPYIVKIWE